MQITMGRPKKNRVKASVMIDRRLWHRITEAARTNKTTRSEALNGMLWAGVYGRMNLQEKEEFCQAIDKIAEMAKSWADNGL